MKCGLADNKHGLLGVVPEVLAPKLAPRNLENVTTESLN